MRSMTFQIPRHAETLDERAIGARAADVGQPLEIQRTTPFASCASTVSCERSAELPAVPVVFPRAAQPTVSPTCTPKSRPTTVCGGIVAARSMTRATV